MHGANRSCQQNHCDPYAGRSGRLWVFTASGEPNHCILASHGTWL